MTLFDSNSKVIRLCVVACMIGGFFPGAASAIAKEKARSDGLTPLHLAAGKGDIKSLQRLLDQGASVYVVDSKMGVSVLHKAIYSGNPAAVALLLKRGALIDLQSPSNGDTPLHDAIYFKKKLHGKEMIELLLQSGVSLSIRNRAGLTPLESAELLKDEETASLIRNEMGRRFSPKGIALMEAVKSKDVQKLKTLLKDPLTPVEEADEQGFTPLLWSAREGMVEITSLLLNRGANPNHLDSWMGANAGHKAGFWGRSEVMKLLVNHRLDINGQGLYNGYTPLHDAVSGNHLETAQVLVNAGAKTDIRGHDGKTPLDIAKENRNADMIKLLNSSGSGSQKK
jgi:ankyrin repeat protein